MSSPETRLDRYLHEALALERTLIGTLEAHIDQTPPGAYKQLLERHLHETRTHAVNLSSRLNTSTSLKGAVLHMAFSLAKAPLGLILGGGSHPDLVKNARDECAAVAAEIALYIAIEALAEATHEDELAELARAHRAQEERMLSDLTGLIGVLAGAIKKHPLPIDGYEGLNAGQVTARLGDLSQSDLERILSYERGHRNRRAVVERAVQLTATPPWSGYDSDDTESILARLDGDTAPAVRDYESRHRRRVAVLEAAQQALTGH